MKKEVRQGAGKSFFYLLIKFVPPLSQKYSDVLCALILQKGSIFFCILNQTR